MLIDGGVAGFGLEPYINILGPWTYVWQLYYMKVSSVWTLPKSQLFQSNNFEMASSDIGPLPIIEDKYNF